MLLTFPPARGASPCQTSTPPRIHNTCAKLLAIALRVSSTWPDDLLAGIARRIAGSEVDPETLASWPRFPNFKILFGQLRTYSP
jgi:hypothetical protein